MDEIPPLTSAHDMSPVRTQTDLHRLWRSLMGPLGFGGRLLWVVVLEADGRPTPTILQIEDLPVRPDPGMRDSLLRFCSCLLDELGPAQLAFLVSRPGRDGLTDDDRAWAATLQDVLRRAGLPVWPVHRANDHELVVVTPDDLAA